MGDFDAKDEEPFDGLALKVRDVPESWDFRVDYADCALTIKDQMSCGSCWAFAASTALQHRFCFASHKEVKDIFGCDLIDISDDEILSRMRKYHIFLDPKSEVNLESTLILMALREIVSDYNFGLYILKNFPEKVVNIRELIEHERRI